MFDPHTRYRDGHPRLRHLDLRFEVDFAQQRLHASALLRFDRVGRAEVVLDTRDLRVHAVRVRGQEVPFALTEQDPVLGTGLAFELPDGVDAVDVEYTTAPHAAALQWLEPEQTVGKRLRYLYTQAQSINARSFVPVQDTMGVRVTYTAEVLVPDGYVARMSANQTGMDRLDDGRRRYRFAAPKAMAPYLIALVVGDLVSRSIGPRSTLWAEPAQLDAAAAEFADLEAIIGALEDLYGPYRWGTADLLVMPPSYPLGGMENPQLTYAAPSLVTGDGSGVNVVTHEIAHHWSGNLVSGESLEHFWINEGPTVYGEWRASERIYGAQTAALWVAVEQADLVKNIDGFRDRPALTRLRRHLDGVDPEADFSLVAHLKGYLFLRAIEESVGRDRFDPVFRSFYDTFAFQALTSEQFVAWWQRRLPDAVDWDTWLHGEGLPSDAPDTGSEIVAAIEELGDDLPDPELADRWGPTGWQVYLSGLDLDIPAVEDLDRRFHISAMPNPDVRRQWIVLGLRAGWAPSVAAALDLVRTVGRMKYLVPVYDALQSRDPDLASTTYREMRSWYHPLARSALDSRLLPPPSSNAR